MNMNPQSLMPTLWIPSCLTLALVSCGGKVTVLGDSNGDAGHPDGSATVETSVSMDEGGSTTSVSMDEGGSTTSVSREGGSSETSTTEGTAPAGCPAEDGLITVTVFAPGAPTSGIAVDDTDVYWSGESPTNQSGSIWRSSKCGGTGTKVTSDSVGSLGAPVLDSTYVYWTSLFGPVMKAPKSGGTAVTLSNGNEPGPLAVDATNFYYGGNNGRLYEMPIVGAPKATLLTNVNHGVAVFGGIAVDATAVYWTASNYGNVVGKIPTGGGTPVALANPLSEPQGIALDATNVYFTTEAGEVVSVPKGGGASVTLASTPGTALAIAVDGANIYWIASEPTDGATSSVLKVPVGGGSVTTLASMQPTVDAPLSVAVDETSVYWATSNGVMKLTPK